MPTINELIVKALEQICYNQTGLDLTIGQIKDAIAAQNTPATQPVNTTDNPTPVA